MSQSRIAKAAGEIQSYCVGRTVEQVAVHGINALKSITPSIADVGGSVVISCSEGSGTTLEVVMGDYLLMIDLQRTGRVRVDDQGTPWIPGQPSMPTAQIRFADGSVANFFEPGRTKRITLRLLSRT